MLSLGGSTEWLRSRSSFRTFGKFTPGSRGNVRRASASVTSVPAARDGVGNRIDEGADEVLLRQLQDVAIAEQSSVLGDELLPHHAGDARKASRQAVVSRRHVALPAAPHQREAAPHQKAVAGMLRVPPVRCPVEPQHDWLVATIGHVVDKAAVAALEIERLQDSEVASILNIVVHVARSPTTHSSRWSRMPTSIMFRC